MEPSGLTGLVPLGGTAVLLIYMLRIVVSERRYWGTERKRLVEEHRQALEDRDNYWRERLRECEGKDG